MNVKFIIKTVFFVISICTIPLNLAAETTALDNKTQLEDKKWVIQSINKDEKETFKGLHLGFIKFLNGSIEGQSTCNIYSGVYSLEKDQEIEFFRIGTTELICKAGNKMDIETAYIEGLEQVKTYKFVDNQLVLLKENNQEFARFKLQ